MEQMTTAEKVQRIVFLAAIIMVMLDVLWIRP